MMSLNIYIKTKSVYNALSLFNVFVSIFFHSKMKLLTKIVLTIPSKIEIERALSLTRQTTSSKKRLHTLGHSCAFKSKAPFETKLETQPFSHLYKKSNLDFTPKMKFLEIISILNPINT